jgi:NAD(P)-dependent dehydrogenase (short-subunit alcohol dehydrogenase family)
MPPCRRSQGAFAFIFFRELEDIANATVFLPSDDSDFVNGHMLSVDGGRKALG